MQFAIDRNNVQAQWLGRLFLLGMAIMCGGFIVIHLLRWGADWGFFIMIAVGVAAVIFIPWGWRRAVGVGSIEFGDTELRVIAKGGTQAYNWADIKDVRKTSPAEMGRSTRLMYQVFGCDVHKPVAVLSLKTSLKAEPLRRRWGTRSVGIPLFAREAMVFPEDVDGFVEATRRFLNQSQNGESRTAWDKPFGLDADPIT